ncbi:MAG: response regulator [Desulfurivibrionaceae bacterium]|jgi:two-component system response regulator|nr:response regulator [Desulfobulbaceae bacterium]MDP2757917.1 response regulator [Desulfurivibrionaceae bacterium]
MVKPHNIDILLVEDDPGDVELTKEGLQDAKMLVNLHVVDDGEKALKFLRKEEPYTNAARPDIILLDLNMPRKSGQEVLGEIKGDPSLRSIPVVILTTSGAESDIATCYDLGANCYITKPISFEAFAKVVAMIEEFWFTIVRMPSKEK